MTERGEPVLMQQWNYFSDSEQADQQRFRTLRDRVLAPLAAGCIRLGITADLISGIALGMLLPFGLLVFLSEGGNPGVWGVVCLAFHTGLDGLDGVIARVTKTDGPVGAVTDMMVDHSGFLIVTSLLALSGTINGGWACVYASAYTTSVIMVIALNVLERPLRFVIRTKYLFYALYSWHILIGALPWLNTTIIVFAAVHTLFAVIGFFALRRALKDNAKQ